MSPAPQYSEPPGFRVTVDRVLHQPDAQTPPERPHCFVYFIIIHNDTDTAITIRARKWVVNSGSGEVTAVEGEGVVGQMPRILPGESFSYNSFHLLDTRSAVAEGSYLGVDATGAKVVTRIPKFKMVVPG